MISLLTWSELAWVMISSSRPFLGEVFSFLSHMLNNYCLSRVEVKKYVDTLFVHYTVSIPETRTG